MRLSIRGLLLCAGVTLASCIATPLPTPPTADPVHMSIVDGAQPGEVDVIGAPGAIEGELVSLRVSSERAFLETTVEVDGSFVIDDLAATDPLTLYVEAVTLDDDVFLVAITRGAGVEAAPTSAGPDRDMDGSPDAIDCAPDDGALGGRRCPEMDLDGDGFPDSVDCDDRDGAVFPGAAELCNGLDDNCDGTIDEGCTACRSDADCAAGQTCTGGVCS